MNTYTDFELEKRKAIKLAKDLVYGEEVIEKLRKAKNESEMQQILTSARKAKL